MKRVLIRIIVLVSSVVAIGSFAAPMVIANEKGSLELAQRACAQITSVLDSMDSKFSSKDSDGYSYQWDMWTTTYENPEFRSKYLLAGNAFLELSKSDSTNRVEFERYAKILTTPNSNGNTGYNWERSKAGLDSSSLFEPIQFCVGDRLGFSNRDDIYANHFLSNYKPGSAPARDLVEESNNDSGETNGVLTALLIVFGILVLLVIQALYIGKTAERAGRSFRAWAVLGFFFPLISALIVWSFKPVKDRGSNSE